MNLDKMNGIGILCSFKAIPFRFWYLTTYNQGRVGHSPKKAISDQS